MVVGGQTMLKLSAADLLLDHTHSRAICDEIGERLRTILKPDVSELPPRLLALIEKLVQLEIDDVPYVRAPPTAPSLEDMCFGETREVLSRELPGDRLPPVRDQLLPTLQLDR
jgi:hypothetical protein